jgi:hypothetical protein
MPLPTFRDYCRKVWNSLPATAKHWARDQIVWPALVTALLTIIPALSLHKNIDWGFVRTGLLLYMVVFLGYGLFQVIRASYRAYQTQDGEVQELRKITATKTEDVKRAQDDLEKQLKQEAVTINRLNEDIRQIRGEWDITERQLYEVKTQLAAANAKIAEKTNEITLLKQIPADIEVEILELQRRAIDSEQEGSRSWKYDVFVRAKLRLKNLDSIAISRMRAEMSLQGALEIPQEIKDIESLRLVVHSKKDGGIGWAYHRIKELKLVLMQGKPEEGWLHYVTNRTTDEELDASSLKLIVETPRGVSHAELDAHTNKWSPWGSGRIVPDPDTTNIGLPNIGE